MVMKARKRPTLTFQPGDEIRAAMEALTDRDGISTSEMIRRALRVYLTDKGVMAEETERPRAATRKRS